MKTMIVVIAGSAVNISVHRHGHIGAAVMFNSVVVEFSPAHHTFEQ